MKHDILVVDDEADIRRLVADVLEDEGYTVRVASSGEQALEVLQSTCQPHLVLLDVWLDDSRYDGLKILDIIQKSYPNVLVIMISGHGTVETAVSAIRKGAHDFIEKPFKIDRLLLAIRNTLKVYTLARENEELKQRLIHQNEIIGESNLTQRLKLLVSKVAPTNSRVLISGGSGVGKETTARSLHRQSARSNNAFVHFNCAEVDPKDFEKELFGSEEEGERHIGAIERANKGVLYLDNISCIPLNIQRKLVAVLQEQKFSPFGTHRKIPFDARIISSTSYDMNKMIANGKFLEDLFVRLSLVSIRVPFLRERRDDIMVLCQHYMEIFNKLYNTPIREFSPEAKNAIENYAWPGNINQLKNFVEWLMIMERGDSSDTRAITLTDLPSEISGASSVQTNLVKGVDVLSMPLREAREAFERQYLVSQINRFSGNISQTAHFVGMERSALHRKLKLLNVGSKEKDLPN